MHIDTSSKKYMEDMILRWLEERPGLDCGHRGWGPHLIERMADAALAVYAAAVEQSHAEFEDD